MSIRVSGRRKLHSLRALREAHPFEGALTASGNIRVDNGRIEFTAPNQPALDIRYRLPAALPPVPQYTGPAEITVLDQSDAGGPDRELIVRTGGALLFAAALKKSPQPIRIDIAKGASVSQMPVDVNAKTRSAPSAVEARDASGAVTMILVGQVTRVQFAGAAVDVFLRASYRIMRGPKEQHEGGYILEGWAVRANQP